MTATEKILLTLCLVNLFALSGFFWWYQYDQSTLREGREEAYRAFWLGDSIQKAQQIRWETIEKNAEEVFKDSVRHGLYKSQHLSFFQFDVWLRLIPEVPGSIFALFFTVTMLAFRALWKDRKRTQQRYDDLVNKVVDPLLADMRILLRDK